MVVVFVIVVMFLVLVVVEEVVLVLIMTTEVEEAFKVEVVDEGEYKIVNVEVEDFEVIQQ